MSRSTPDCEPCLSGTWGFSFVIKRHVAVDRDDEGAGGAAKKVGDVPNQFTPRRWSRASAGRSP
jgi:hypothetical protein